MAITSIYSVVFAGNDLSLLNGVTLYNHDANKFPERNVIRNRLARRDKSIITSSNYTFKEIPVYMDICGGSKTTTEEYIAQVKAVLQPQNQSLKVLNSGKEVEYTATLNQFNIQWNGANAYCELVFMVSDPIGKAVDTTTMFNIAGNTNAIKYETFKVNGSSLAYPIITVTVNSVTGGTGKTITLQNGFTNQGIRVTADWVDNDVLIVDSSIMKVTINGLNVDFKGMFPQFAAGSQQFSYLDDFDDRNVDITATYQERYV